MKLKGVTPVIAHPERCFEFEKKGRAAEAVQLGAILQLDMGALEGRYGKNAQRLSRQFLDEGLYGIAATDLHSPVGAAKWVGDSLKAIEKFGGKGALQRLVSENPAHILAGRSW
jgi:protein-tyrosine phosphatase